MTIRSLSERTSPLWLGIGISGSLLLILLLAETVLGRLGQVFAGDEFNAFAIEPEGLLRDLRIAIVHCLLIGYLPAAFLYVLKNSRQTVMALQETLDCTRQECETLAESVRLKPFGLVIFGILGIVLSIAGPYLVPPVPISPWNPSTWNPEVAWHRILGPVALMWAWWLGYAVISVSLNMSRIASKLNRIDLLDHSSLTPFTQLGLTNSLALIGSFSIWSLMSVEAGFGQVMLIVGFTTLVSISFAMLLPVRGVHKRISQSKEAELNWVGGEISNQRSAFQSHQPDQPNGKMADLIAYRGLIENVPEWPFTTSTYTRIFLYALLPLASWTIGMVAEELIGRALF